MHGQISLISRNPSISDKGWLREMRQPSCFKPLRRKPQEAGQERGTSLTIPLFLFSSTLKGPDKKHWPNVFFLKINKFITQLTFPTRFVKNLHAFMPLSYSIYKCQKYDFIFVFSICFVPVLYLQ